MALVLAWLAAAASAQSPPAFTDAAPRSAFSYTTNNGFTGRKYFPQPLCGGVAAFDFDNDGWVDLYFTNGASFPELRKTGPEFHNALLRNRRDGTFEDVTARAGLSGEALGYSLGVATADFDNDGFTDLFVANAGANTLYRNRGDGTFAGVTAASGLHTKPPGTLSVQGAWVDIDNDGLLDLAVSNYTVWTPETDIRCVRDDGVDFYCHPKTYPAVPHRLYRNLGGGKFADITDASGFGKERGKGMGIAVADVNRDGWMDVFIANDTERNFLFLNRRNGTFQEQGLLYGAAYNDDAATVSAMGADAKDFDNDGWPDLFYNDLLGQGWGLFRNLTGRSFRYVSPAARLVTLSEKFSGWSGGFIDYDNDGWKDLFSANGDVDSLRPNAEQHDTMFRNLGGKEFAGVSASLGPEFARTGYQRGAAFADFNNDGAMDIAVTSLGKRPRILLNGARRGHWLLLDLRGTKSNRDAIGAAVKITTAAGRVLHNHVTTSAGFLSSSDRRVHFGLGAESAPVSIEIRWPSGGVDLRRNQAADRQHSIVEGK